MERSTERRSRSQDFQATAARVLQHLHATVGLDMWAVGRRQGEHWLVLSCLGADLEGVQYPWEDTLCARVNDGLASWVTPDVDSVPALVEAREALGLPIASFVTVPLQGDDGALLGTLCGAGTAPADERLADCREELEVLAEVLASLLSAELRLEREARHREVAEVDAQTDALTDLGNRRRWDQHLAAEEERCRRYGGTAAVLTIDLNGLKVVNDRWGHDAGDALLRQLSGVLRRECRPGDVVARLGGDEFAVLLAETSLEQAEAVAGRLRGAMEQAQVSASMGLAVRGAEGLGGAWREADARMYEHKRAQTRADPVRPPTQTPTVGQSNEALVQELLALGLEHTHADLILIGRIDGADRVVRAVQSHRPEPIRQGAVNDGEAIYCQRMLAGELPRALPDTSLNALARELPSTAALTVGAYLGVPLHLTNGQLYGTLCCISHRPNPRFDGAGVAFLTSIAASLSRVLSGEEEERASRRQVLADIDDVLQGDGVRMVYQPVIDLVTGATRGVEALARFENHSRSTAQWFYDAARVERTTEVELRTARTALLESAQWETDLWLNLSASVLASPAVTDLLQTRDLTHLVVEISEHEQVADYQMVRRALDPWRGRGLRLAVDDAGAGFSSLRHILELTPDVIKLDVSLVRGLPSDAARRALVTALVAFAHEAGAQVVAEGVESGEEVEALRRSGVTLGQGFHLGAPEPAAQQERRQARRNVSHPRRSANRIS